MCMLRAFCSLNSLTSIAVPDVHPVFPFPSVLKVHHVKLVPSILRAWTSTHIHMHRVSSPQSIVEKDDSVVIVFKKGSWEHITALLSP